MNSQYPPACKTLAARLLCTSRLSSAISSSTLKCVWTVLNPTPGRCTCPNAGSFRYWSSCNADWTRKSYRMRTPISLLSGNYSLLSNAHCTPVHSHELCWKSPCQYRSGLKLSGMNSACKAAAIAVAEASRSLFLVIFSHLYLLSPLRRNPRPSCSPFPAILSQFPNAFSLSFPQALHNCQLSFWIWYLWEDYHQTKRTQSPIKH